MPRWERTLEMSNDFTPGSWEHAAYEAAAMFIKDFVVPHGPVDIEEMESLHEGAAGFKSAVGICDFGRYAWAGYYHAGGNKTITQIVEFIAGKQHDYGNDNILKWGAEGIKIRTWDKLARIRNLQKRGSFKNETVADAWFDCLGYAIVAYMLLLGTFTRPLQVDMVSAETVASPLVLHEDQMVVLTYLGFSDDESNTPVYRVEAFRGNLK